jgi:hypothetical protein
MIKFIDWNERRHREEAINYLKSNSSLAFYNLAAVQQHRLTSELPLQNISDKIMLEKQFNNSKPTCIALSEDLIIIGNSLGELWMYDRETQEPYDCFMEKGKEF